LSKELSRLGDPDELDLDDCVPAYLILFDKKTKMYRAYHADISDIVVLDSDPINALVALTDILDEGVNHEEDAKYN
jgi:hypothetical protein